MLYWPYMYQCIDDWIILQRWPTIQSWDDVAVLSGLQPTPLCITYVVIRLPPF